MRTFPGVGLRDTAAFCNKELWILPTKAEAPRNADLEKTISFSTKVLELSSKKVLWPANMRISQHRMQNLLMKHWHYRVLPAKKINYHDFGVHVDASFMDLTLVFKPLCLLEYKPYHYGELDPHSSLELHFHAESTQSKWNDWRQPDKGPKAPSTFVCQRTKLGSRDHLLTLLKNHLTSAYAIF